MSEPIQWDFWQEKPKTFLLLKMLAAFLFYTFTILGCLKCWNLAAFWADEILIAGVFLQSIKEEEKHVLNCVCSSGKQSTLMQYAQVQWNS